MDRLKHGFAVVVPGYCDGAPAHAQITTLIEAHLVAPAVIKLRRRTPTRGSRQLDQKGTPIKMHITASALLNARHVSRNLEEAIASYEAFVPSGQDAQLINRVNKAAINPGFNIISVSLHHTIVITLCRIWDHNRDAASIWSLTRKLKNKALIAEFAKRPGGIDSTRISAWSKFVEAAGRSEEIGALLAARNHWLAHTKAPDKLYQGKARQVLYGDERKVIEMTIPLVEEANALVGYTYFPFSEFSARWKREAKKFWAGILPSQ